MEKVRTIKLFKNYYKEFYVAQTFDVRHKINQVLKLVETQRIVPAKFLRIIEVVTGSTRSGLNWEVISTECSAVLMRVRL